MKSQACEIIARNALDRARMTAPIEARELAFALDLTVVPSARHARCAKVLNRIGYVAYDPSAPRLETQSSLARQIATVLYREKPDAEAGPDAIRTTGNALLVPTAALDFDLGVTWNVQHLARIHPNASPAVLAERICDLRDAACTIFGGRTLRVVSRLVSPHLDRRFWRVSELERELAQEARATGRIVHRNDRCYALPYAAGRILVVIEAEQLSLRLDHQ